MGMYGWHDNDLEAYNVIVENDLTVKGTISFGDEVADKLIIQGRVSSMTAAGAAMQITSAYAYGEGIEMRYQVTNWTGVGSSFKGMYLRAEAITGSAAAKSVYGAEIYGVCNNVTMTTGSLWGALFYAYVKGVAAVTVNNMYAVQGELTWDASRTGDCTITTAAACFRAKITGGRVADYTRIHGYELTIGEMDGDSAKFGKGLFMQDDSGMSGTCTLTTGIDIAIGCTTGISIGGATTDALSISGDATTAINVTSGCSPTNALLIAGATTDAIKITGDASSAGILMSSTCTPPYGIKLENACTTAGFEVAAACAKGVEISGACTTSGIDVAADCQLGLDIGAQTTASIIISGASVDGLKIDADMTTGINITSNVTATDGVLIAGACADAIHISGVNTANAINISGAQVTGNAIAITSTGTLTGTLKGLAIDYDGVTLGTFNNTGIEVLMHATYGGTGTEYAIYASGDGTTVALCSDAATAITIGGTVTTGLSIGTSTTGISIGNCVKGIELGTFGSPVTVQNSDWDTAGGAYTITKAMVSGCLNEDLSDSQCVRQLWSRFKITASQTAGSGKDYYGAEMQVRPHTGSAAIELAGGTYAGVWNYWENSDSAHALTVSGGYHYGSINMVELCSTGVISGGTFAAANMTNHVDTDPASATLFDAILINKVSGAYDWKIGVDVNNCVTGINIGAATNAFAFPVAGTAPVSSGADASADVEGSIKILVNNVAKYLHYWPNAT